MDSWRVFSKTPALACILLLLFLLVSFTPATALEFSGASLPGLNSLRGCLGGTSGCGKEACTGLGAPVFYTGWMGARNGISYELSSDTGRLAHQYPLQGVWVGAAETVALNDNLGAVLSGWILVQGNKTHTSEADGNTPYKWDRTPTNWYYLDGLLTCKGPGGITGLAGFRYEDHTSHFRKLEAVLLPDSADVKINHYIPLVGVQWNYDGADTNLVFRTVGFPGLYGNFNLVELFGLVPFEAKATYQRGYFLEIFSEYSRRLCGIEVGVFGKWNLAHATSHAQVVDQPGSPAFSESLSLLRTTWTVGGSLHMEFSTPL